MIPAFLFRMEPVSERTPLLLGSYVKSPEPPNTQSTLVATNDERFKGHGYTISGGPITCGGAGLVSEPDNSSEEVVCWGYEETMYSILARLPALHTFALVAFFTYFGHIWLLMQRPDIAVTIILSIIFYGMFRFWSLWIGAWVGLNQLLKNDSRDPNYWQRQPRPAGSPEFSSIWHGVIVPNYKEPIDKLRQTLDTIATQSIAKQIVVCMAMESRDPKGEETALQLQREYAHRLGGFCYALHPLIPGEVAGKSSNENWAARCLKGLMVDRMRVNPDCILFTTCDADTFFHINHFAYLTHLYLSDGEDRYYRFYLPVTNFMPNIMDVPGICSARFTVLTVGRMAELGNPLASPFPLAIYALPLRLAQQACYWDPKVIPEDWHMYFRCVYADTGRVQCTRQYMAVGTECVEGKDYLDTVNECYQQSVRWQWGAIDMGYLIVQTAARWNVPVYQRLKILISAYDHHLFSVAIILCLFAAPWLYGRIPVALDMNIWTGATALVKISMILSAVWIVHFTVHITSLCLVDYQIRHKLLYDRLYFNVAGKEAGNCADGPLRWLTLLLFPLADLFLFVVPTIHAHTKMFISSSFNYVPSAKQSRCCRPSDLCGGDDQGRDTSV
jgi:hypothetical protein